MNLFLDIETRSTVDLKKTGQYVYAEHASTEIIMVAYAVDNDPVAVWIPPRSTAPDTSALDTAIHTVSGNPVRMFGGEIPMDLLLALADSVTMRDVAHNASFERILLSSGAGERIGVPDLYDVRRWDCTAARAAMLGLPRTLEGAGAALGLGIQKDKEGHALMLRMCKPRKPTKAERQRDADAATMADLFGNDAPAAPVRWVDDPESIARLAAYCARDVEVEREIWRILPDMPTIERRVWELTERMNDEGVPVDVPLLGAMLRIIEDTEIRLDAEISEATGGAVPRVTDHMALTRWLVAQGIDDAANDGVGKAAVAAMLDNSDLSPFIRNVLALRRDGGGTSSKKYRAILARLSADGRIRGVLVYCGAASTGRWSSRGAQLQNLSRGGNIKGEDGDPVDALNMVRDVLAGASAAEIEMIYGPALVVAAECLRPLFTVPANDDDRLPARRAA